MNKLMIFRVDGEKLDCEEVLGVLNSLEGVHSLRRGKFVGSVLDCEFDFGDDSTIIRLSDDFNDISMTGLGDASIKAAFEFQRRIGVSFRAIDLAYSFDILLSGFDSFEALKTEIEAA